MLIYLQERNLLATSGFLKLKRTLMALLNDTKHDLWPSEKSRIDGLKRYKHVIYIKKCRHSTIVQYEQHILQRNTKMKHK